MEKIYEIQAIKQEVRETTKNRYTIRSPFDVAEHAYNLIGELDREAFLVMVLNTKNHIIAYHQCHLGSLNSSVVHPREVFKAAILNNGASIIGIHAHPSGDPTQSQEDVLVSRRLSEAGKILGIEFIDSIIIGEKVNGRVEHISLKEKGYL